MACKHEYEKCGEPTGFCHCLADSSRGYTCNPAAHGAVNVHLRCRLCGHESRANINGSHHEPRELNIIGWVEEVA